jgi:hypothetical protein
MWCNFKMLELASIPVLEIHPPGKMQVSMQMGDHHMLCPSRMGCFGLYLGSITLMLCPCQMDELGIYPLLDSNFERVQVFVCCVSFAKSFSFYNFY